jgi:hypothetical protein
MNCVKKHLSLVAVVATVALVSAGVAEAKKLALFVDVDEASFVGPAAGEQGPFNVEGDTGSGAQTFQCWGWIFENLAANVSQVYNIPGRGMIMTQGLEGGLLAVVGGTGDFRGVRGEGLQTFTGVGFDFNIEFDLKGGGG